MTRKFASKHAEKLWISSLDGIADEEFTVEGGGWYGRIGKNIVGENTDGFVFSSVYLTESEAETVFAGLEASFGEREYSEDNPWKGTVGKPMKIVGDDRLAAEPERCEHGKTLYQSCRECETGVFT